MAAIIGMLGTACLLAASEPPQDTLAEAQRLREAGSFKAAADLLRTRVAERPDDGEAKRLLAQTLYWLKDYSGASAVYDAALIRHPEDTTLRLQYARMLAETGDRARARGLVTPLLEIPAVRAEAGALLGTIAYWDGDLDSARKLFREALETNPNQEEARRQLDEIQNISASWFRVTANASQDDQPLTRLVAGFEAGWFATPLTQFTARVQPIQHWLNGSATTVSAAEGGVTRYTPSLRLETEVAGGGVRRSQAGGLWDWTGRAAAGVRLPAHFTLRARAERSAYLSTVSSLDTRLMVQTLTGLLHWGETRGWSGEAAYQRTRYPDNNHVKTAYGWLLAPLIFQERAEIEAGYAVAFSNADQSRFFLVKPNQPYSPGDPRFETAGHYTPYYTPNHLLTHSAIAALKLEPARRLILRLGGSYAVHATDKAPFFYVSGAQAVPGVYDRKFSPWNAHMSLELALGDGLTLEPTAEIGHSAFYSWTSAGLQIAYRFNHSRGIRAHAP